MTPLDKYYNPYLRYENIDLNRIESFRVIKSWCRGRILDIGCGVGYLTAYLGAEGMDADAGAIAYARRHYVGSRFYLADAAAPPRRKLGRFDAIVCNNLVEHLDEGKRRRLFAALPGLLKRGGVVIFGYADPYHPAQLLSGLLQRKVLFDPTHVRNWPARAFESMLAERFSLLEVRRTSPFSRLLRLGKWMKGDLLVRCALKRKK